MPEYGIGINTGADFSGVPGAIPLLDPFPRLGGSLYAAYMLGNAYARHSRVAGGEAYGAALDWSGNGRHLTTLGDAGARLTDYGLTAAVTADEPRTPFSLADIFASNSAFSIVVLAKSVAGARTVALVRVDPTVTDPTAGLYIYPQTPQVRASATVSAVSGTAQLTPTDELGAEALYGATFTSAQRRVFSKVGTEDTKTSPQNTALGAITNDMFFEFADEAGTGTGNTIERSAAFYDRVITQEEFELCLLRLRIFHTTIGTELPI